MKHLTTPIVLALLLVSGMASAKGDAEAGKTKAAPCAACHGPDGNAGIDPQYPRLAGQYRDYIVQALHEYKKGERSHPTMRAQGESLSEQDMRDIATYLSSITP